MYRPPLTLPAARRVPSLLDAIEYHLAEVVEGADVFNHELPPIMIIKKMTITVITDIANTNLMLICICLRH